MDANPQEGKISLTGLFQPLHFRRFPSPLQKFTVYAALYDGVGEGTMELEVARLETEEKIYSHKRWVTFPGRGMLVNLEMKVGKCVFPAPGQYMLSLRFDHQELSQRNLEIFRNGD
jgi:hypothetical protein